MSDSAEKDKLSKIAEAHAAVDTFSAVASEQTRKLAFVGFALIALFGGIDGKDFTFPMDLPTRLIWAGLMFAIALASDLLQYLYGAVAFSIWARRQERARSNAKSSWTEPTGFPSAINRPTWTFFGLKFLAVVAGWSILLVYLAQALT